MIRTSFKSENLKVDYLSFNFQFNNFKQIINLLKELVKYKIIHSQLAIVFKSGNIKQVSVESLTVSNITRRVKYLKFSENIRDLT